MPVISISVPKALLKAIDEYVKQQGYSGRSELFREAARDFISRHCREGRKDGETAWVLVLLTNRNADPSINEKLSEVLHSSESEIKSFQDQALYDGWSIKVVVLETREQEIESIAESIREIKGVMKVLCTPIKLRK